MTEREQLAKLIETAVSIMQNTPEKLAAYLLDHSIIVPPCKVGDTVYQTDGCRIYESTVRKIIYDTDGIAFDKTAIGTSVFLAREEAEAAPAERIKS